jgi:hypothetical protein
MATTAQSFGFKRHDHSGTQTEELVSQAKVAAGDATDFVLDAIRSADKLLRPYVTNRPNTTALGAIAVGYVLGRFGGRY